MKKSGKLFLILLIVLVIFAGMFFYKNLTDTSAVDPTDHETYIVEIPSGSGTSKIATILRENDLIKSEFAFKSAAKKEGITSDFKAGKYELSRDMDIYDIFNIITVAQADKKDNLVRVTIPEGYELTHIANRFAENNLVDENKFLELAKNKNNFDGEFEFLEHLNNNQSLEGYLFPATYEVEPGQTEEEIILMMLKAFNYIYETEIKSRLNNSEMTLNEIVTLASIIEREGRLDEERPIMSSVFHNRIEKGMNLGSCATVQYIIGERKPVLSTQDTKIDSPFNTYINKGLPPAPIAAPGKVSIVAAVEPADTDYLFFVLTGKDGSHTFTKTYQEHEEAKKNMIRE